MVGRRRQSGARWTLVIALGLGVEVAGCIGPDARSDLRQSDADLSHPRIGDAADSGGLDAVDPETTEPDVVEPDVGPEEVTPDVIEPEEVAPDVVELEEVEPDVVEPEEVVTRAPDLAALHVAIDEYLDRRFDAPADATDALVDRIEAEGASVEQVEAILRAGRASYPDVTKSIGVISEHVIDCQHVDYSSTWFLSVPATYDPSVAAPVVFVTYPAADAMAYDDARAAALKAVEEYRDAMHAFGALVVSPVTTRGWSPIADSLVYSVLSDLQRTYHIDPDAVHVVGRGSGGHMVWRSIIVQTDRWASVAPIGGGYDEYLSDDRLGNLFGTHGFQAWSSANSSFARATNMALAGFIADHGYDWQAREFQSDDIAPTDEVIDQIGAYFASHRRDTAPAAVWFWSGGTMRYDTNWAGQTDTIYLDRAYRWNQRHWLEIEPNPGTSERVEVSARVLDDHTIVLHGSQARSVRVYVDPRMGIDMTKDLDVFANNLLRWHGKVEVDLGHMLEVVREWDDRARTYRGWVDVTIPTDEVVEPPIGQP